jgi:hypothetical protein
MTGPLKVILAVLTLTISLLQIAYFSYFWLISCIVFFVIITTIELAGYGASNIHINSDAQEVWFVIFILIFYAGFSSVWPFLIVVKWIECSDKVPFSAKRLLVKLKKTLNIN